MRRDRFGDLVDDEDQADAVDQLHHCDGGWLDRDADHPRPCLTCRPHLRRTRPHPPPDTDRIHAGVRLVLAQLHQRNAS